MKKESLNENLHGMSVSMLAFFVAAWATVSVAAPSIWTGGKDTTWYAESAQAFNLTTAEELAGLAYLVNNGTTFQGKTITLGADIFLNDTTGAGKGTWSTSGKRMWTPIGTLSNPFKGEFDGLAGKKNRKIYGLYINDTTKNYVGLFGYTNGVKISNLDLLVGYVDGKNYAGSLVGNSFNGSIENIHSELNVVGKDTVGGIAGCGHEINDASVIASIKGNNYVGGISGKDSSITNSTFEGYVKGTSYVGGVSGWVKIIKKSNSKGTIEGNSSNIGGVTGSANIIDSVYHVNGIVQGLNYVGGIAGSVWESINGSYHKNGMVKGTSYVGGAIGKNSGSVENIFSEADVEGENFVGGLIGQSYLSAQSYSPYTITSISKSHSIGNVIGKNYVGGVIGQDYINHTKLISSDKSETITRNVLNIFSKGNVSGNVFVGGIIGASQRNDLPKDSRNLPYTVVSTIDSSYHTDGNVVGKGNYVGGLVGFDSLNTIKNSFYEKGDIVGFSYVGGLTGFALGLIDSSFVEGNIRGFDFVGGLVGKMKNFRDEYTEHGSSVAPSIALLNGVSHSHVNGVIQGNGDYIGGLIGSVVFVNRASEKIISNSTFEGVVEGKNFVGGIVGIDSAYKDSKPTYISNYQEVQNPLIVTIANSTSKGSVQGVNFVGGIVGKSIPAGYYLDYVKFQIYKCLHSDGNVTGDSNSVGGIAGNSIGSISYSSHSNGLVEGVSEVGGIAGYTDTIIESYVNSSVAAKDSIIGGLAGRASFVKNSHVIASYVRGNNIVGGLVGSVGSSVTNSYFVGDSVTGIYQVGGLVGVANGNVDSSYSIANVKGDDNVGGLIGSSYGDISYSYATGNVIGDVNNSSAGNDNLGGLVGYAYKGSISKSLATGDVSGTTKLGGLVGRFDGIGISQSYAQGNVTGSFYGDPIDEVGNFYIGGLIGYGKGSISETYVSGSVKGIEEGPVYTGCIVGYVNGSMEITDSYFDSEKCNLPFEGKTGIATISNTPAQTSAAMQTVSTYENWDFIDTWKNIDESYPKLQWYSSSLAEAVIETASLSGFVYDGKEKTPAVKSVKLYGSVLDAETDYTISYQGNVNAGTASINVCGNGEYSGCKIVSFNISPVAAKPSIAAIDNQIYSGDSIRPGISVIVADTVVGLSSYRLTYSNNVNAGKASVQVTLTGNFSGSAKTNFVIEKAKPIIKTLPTAQDIYYGQTFKNSILKEGVASVDGSFTWSKSDVIPEPENKGYEIMFTPSDMNNYLVVKDTIHLTVKKCVVVFTYGKDTLQVDSLMYGEIPQFDGDISRKVTAQYIYTFKTWSPKIVGATGWDSYEAVFDSTLQKYTISFFSDDSLLQSSKYEYGETPSLKSSNPKKKMSEGYSYKFKGWSPQIATVTENAEYKAVYDSTIRSYTVTLMNGESVLSTMTVEYGKVPEYTGKPTKKSTEKYRYNFVGWNPKVAAITGNTQYQAVYDSVLQSYVVTFFNGTTVLQKDTLSYGVTPKYKGKTPTKKSSKTYSYKFKEWSPKIVAVTKAATYTAVFDSTKLTGIIENRFADLGVSVKTAARVVQISAAPIGSVYVITDLRGRVLKKGRVESANFNIAMPQAGVYMVRIGSQSRKVNLR